MGAVWSSPAVAAKGAATSVTAKAQLRGHLPELGERPTMRVFLTEAAYDTYQTLLEVHPADPAAVRALVRMAEIRLQAHDASGSRELLELALTHPACVGTWRDSTERLKLGFANVTTGREKGKEKMFTKSIQFR